MLRLIGMLSFFLFCMVGVFRMESYRVHQLAKSSPTDRQPEMKTDLWQKESLEKLVEVVSPREEINVVAPQPENEIQLAKEEKNERDEVRDFFIQEFYSNNDNLLHVRALHRTVKESSQSRFVKKTPLEMLYYLVINERFELSELLLFENFRDLRYSKKELKDMYRVSKTAEFESEILRFKGIDTTSLDQKIENGLAKYQINSEEIPEKLKRDLKQAPYSQSEVDEMIVGYFQTEEEILY